MKRYLVILVLLALAWFLGKKLLRQKAVGSGHAPIKRKPVSRVDELAREKFKIANQDFLNNLHPAERAKYEAFIDDIEAMGYTAVLTSGNRTFQRSAELKKQDARNASPGFSFHNYGLAVDLVLVKDGKYIQKNATKAAWEATGVPQMAKKKYGFRWGGDFAGYADNVHFDSGNKYDTKKLYAAALKQFGTVDKVLGNRVDLSKIV